MQRLSQQVAVLECVVNDPLDTVKIHLSDYICFWLIYCSLNFYSDLVYLYLLTSQYWRFLNFQLPHTCCGGFSITKVTDFSGVWVI